VPIDDEIDAARTQIEFGKTTVAPKIVSGILDGLVAVGITPLKPAAFMMKKVYEQREENTAYLLEATISKLRRLENEFRNFSEAHKRFVEEELPRLMVEAVSKADQTRSTERIERMSLIVVHAMLQGPGVDLGKADEAIRISVDLDEQDIDILRKLYHAQTDNIRRRAFLPELNVVNQSWKELQDQFQIFKSSEIYSICSKLQSFGLVTQVQRMPTVLDLTSTPYSILRKGAEYLESITWKLPVG
jgi:hypothetical protein